MSNKKTEETFKHINENWKEEDYKKCESEWKHVQIFISEEQTPYQCGGCNTYWTKVTFVNDHENICPKCDTWCQPYLCNPINWKSVVKYIDEFNDYLIPPRNNISCFSLLHYIQNEIEGEFALVDDKFYAFIDGLTLKTINIEFIGFYEEETKNAWFYIKNVNKYKNNILYNAWKLFWNNDEISVSIYKSCYERYNNHKIDKPRFYKYLMKMLVNKIIDKK